jgi:pilus assembly protein TadC
VASERTRELVVDGLALAVLLTLLAMVLASIGIIPLAPAVQTIILAGATAVLSGASFLFNTVTWKSMEAKPRILDRGRADLILTAVSILSLFTVIVMLALETVALLAFLGPLSRLSSAGAALADSLHLFPTIMLLVYLLAIFVRQSSPPRSQPKFASRVFAHILTPIAFASLLYGVLLAGDIGGVGGLGPRHAVYFATFGVVLEFAAMRTRLALPSIWALSSSAIAEARRSNEEMQDLIRRRAQRAYIIGIVFVAVSMVFAAILATSAILRNAAVAWTLAILHSGLAVVLLGVLAVRMLQQRHLRKKAKPKQEEKLKALIGQKRRSPAEVLRMAVYIISGFLSAVTLALCVLTAMDRTPMHPKLATDLFILAALLGAGPPGFFFNQERRRIAAIDEKFPDFLRDLAESARAGMTLPRALVTASQGTYGALTPEIKTMAAQVQWGVDFGDALRRFAKRTKTPLIDRTVALVVEAQRAGGNVVDVLTAASEDAREIKQIVSERNTQMSMYNVVIYIAYFVFLVVVLVLSVQFIPAFHAAVGVQGEGGAAGAQVGGLTFKAFDPEDFNTLFFQAAVVQAIGGGLVGGVLSKGHPLAGFIHIAVMLAVAWFCFRILVGLMTGA